MSGNALHRVLAFTHVHVKHVVTQSIHAVVVEGVQDEQSAHLLRQTIKIGQGEQVDFISAILPVESDSTEVSLTSEG